jgi:WD40 repeat protein
VAGDGIAASCPYPGLAAFGPEQARWFFGRDRLIAELVDRTAATAECGGMLAVVAVSGAGKSSALRAGLLPAISRGALPIARSRRWPQIVMTPTAHPARELASQLSAFTGVPSPAGDTRQLVARLRHQLWATGTAHRSRLVLVVDQFEELFTLCSDSHEGSEFVDLLTQLAAPGEDSTPLALVIVGLRADFYGMCVAYPAICHALRDNQVLVGPMTDSELRDAILFPAIDVGLDLESGLVELLLRDLGRTSDGTPAAEAGRLPFLAHALRMTWEQRHGSTLTVAGYQATGGIQHAVALTSERVYGDLDSQDQALARMLLLRLIRVDERWDVNRRRLSTDELFEGVPGQAHAAAVLDAFVKARLVSQDRDTVEVTHEAVLRGSPLLWRWIEADRAGYRVRQDLEQSAIEWAHSKPRDSTLLYRGTRLAIAQSWASSHHFEDLSPLATEFLQESRRGQVRAARARRAAAASLTVLAILMSVASFAAIVLGREASQQRDRSIVNQLNAQADQLRATDPGLAGQLDLVADGFSPRSPAQLTRLYSAQNTAVGQPTRGHTGGIMAVAFSSHGNILATASIDRTIRLWDVRSPGRPIPLGPALSSHDSSRGRQPTSHNASVMAIAFSPSGTVLASSGASTDPTIRLWDVHAPRRVTPLGPELTGHSGAVMSVAFSPSGNALVSGGADRTVRLWNICDEIFQPRAREKILKHDSPVLSVAFSPDGRTIASGDAGGNITVSEVDDPSRTVTFQNTLEGRPRAVMSVAFDPRDRKVLAAASADTTIKLWDVHDSSKPRLLGSPLTLHTRTVMSVAFNQQGTLLASASDDETVRLWDLHRIDRPDWTGQPLTGHIGTVMSVAFSPDGTTLATGGASADRTVRMWDVHSPTHPIAFGQPGIGHTDTIMAVTFHPKDPILATGGRDATVRLWNVREPAAPRQIGLPLKGHTGPVMSVAVRPDGGVLASASADGTIRLWDLRDPQRPQPLGEPLRGRGDRTVMSVAFSPEGELLADARADGTVQLWDVADPAAPRPIGHPLVGHRKAVMSVAFTPDGTTLATASDDKTTRLWNVADPAGPKALGQSLGGHTDSVMSVVFAHQGTVLVTGSADQTARVWNVRDRHHPRLYPAVLRGHVDTIMSMAVSPAGDTLATASSDRTIRLWDIGNPARPRAYGQPITGHTDTIMSVAFPQRGTSMATAGVDQSILLWELDHAKAINRICAATTRPLTPAQWRRHVSQDSPYRAPCPRRVRPPDS